MNRVVCIHPLIPIRSEPDHRSEQVSQLLFGETACVKNKDKEWLEITTDFDNYSGWVYEKALEFNTIHKNSSKNHIVSEPVLAINKDNQNFYIPAGSEIPTTDTDSKFILGEKTFHLQDKLNTREVTGIESILNTSKQFLNAPYLWGGRTIFGFDCSGFVQIVFKINGVNFPRDTEYQAKQGAIIDNIELALPGDLLFFTNKENIISHVGIYLCENKLIHASVSVRIDSIDKKGIYNAELKEYTHELFCIKRYLNF